MDLFIQFKFMKFFIIYFLCFENHFNRIGLLEIPDTKKGKKLTLIGELGWRDSIKCITRISKNAKSRPQQEV